MKNSFLEKLKKVSGFFKKHPIISCILTTLLINFIIESLSRHSVIEALCHTFTRPLVFLYNSSIIFMTLSVAFLFKRKNFVIFLLSILWLTLGVVNCILLFFRTTPLSLIDFFIIKNAITILPLYLGAFEVILLSLWIIFIIWSLIVIWKKSLKVRMSFKKSISTIAISVVLVFISSTVSVSIASKTDAFAVLTKAYDKWGFVYCFSRGLIDSGIEKPEKYSLRDVTIALEISKKPKIKENVLPNVVVLQLESFFDVSSFKGHTCSEDPIPTFNWVKNNGPSGFLTVPSIGGGTANTEFEVLTGICLDIFGIGEYPYQTILKETPCDSMARTLKNKGYVSTAIHNHTAIFYKRNQAYGSLGFDKFASVEFMNAEKNELGWSLDSTLLGEISEALTSTPEKDFIFTVTVQGHGKYPEENIAYDKKITMDGFDHTNETEMGLNNSWNYYINQLRQTDDVIKQLIEYFSNYPEPVALVLYGDHLPSFNVTDENFEGHGMYQTEYCMWTNYTDLKHTREDITSYQLNALIFEKLGLNAGMIPQVTQTLKNDSRYKDTLSILAYDMLYGNNYALGKPLERTDILMGINPLKIYNVEFRDETALIYGNKFTPYSTVFVDGEKVETVFVDQNLVKIDLEALNRDGCEIVVAQLNHYSDNLGQSEPYIIKF